MLTVTKNTLPYYSCTTSIYFVYLLRTLYISFKCFYLLNCYSVSAESIFTLNITQLDWFGAKAACESIGERLAVLDTEAKITALKDQIVDIR